MPEENLVTAAEPVLRWCRERPRAIAVMENSVSYSYETLARNVAQAARTLATAGLRPGMIAGIECTPRYRHLVLMLACEILGAAHAALVEGDLTIDTELARRCDILCVESTNANLLTHPRTIRLSPLFLHTMFQQPVDNADLAVLGDAWPADDVVRIGRTSGTTGRQKFVIYAREQLRNNVDAIPYLLHFDEARQNFISLYNFIQIGSYTDAMSALRHGATVVFSLAEELAANIRKFPACHTFLVVRDVSAILASKQFQHGRLDSCSLCVTSGFVPPALRAELRRTVTAHVRSMYSMVETRFITFSDDDGPGVLLPDISVRLVDDSGRDVGPGEPGRILARTPRMAAGYLDDDAQTAAYFVNGWYHTSDIGIMPEPGKLVVLGRADEMINLGGIKLAPNPIEERIRAADNVTDVVLVGLDNAAGTGELHIFIERIGPVSEPELDALIAPLLLGYVTTYVVHFTDRLPRAGSGKIQRHILRRSLLG
jgi:acyl-coenzyme A synthetase/AMP-(fatty) acid ligase